MVVRVLDDERRIRFVGLAHDALVQRVVPARVDGDVDVVLGERPREIPQAAEVVRSSRSTERWRTLFASTKRDAAICGS